MTHVFADQRRYHHSAEVACARLSMGIQSKVGQGRAGQGRAGQGREGQCRTEHSSSVQCSAVQGRQDRAQQCSAGQNKIPRHPSIMIECLLTFSMRGSDLKKEKWGLFLADGQFSLSVIMTVHTRGDKSKGGKGEEIGQVRSDEVRSRRRGNREVKSCHRFYS